MWRGGVGGREFVPEPVVVRSGGDGGKSGVVDAREESRTEDRSIQDLIGGFAPDARGHGMTDVFRNADPEAKFFGGVRGKRGVVDLVIDGFHPRELKERANVSDAPSSEENGLSMVERRVGNAIEDVSHVAHAEEPEFRWRTGAIHKAINGPFESLIPTFEHVLVLMVGFATP